jgi:hypothetical protein
MGFTPYYEGPKGRLFFSTTNSVAQIGFKNSETGFKIVSPDAVFIIPQILPQQKNFGDFLSVALQAAQGDLANPYFKLVDGILKKIPPGLSNSWSSAAGGKELYYLPPNWCAGSDRNRTLAEQMDDFPDGTRLMAQYSILLGPRDISRC